MKVIYYQLLIIATILLAHRIDPRLAIWAALAWSAETLIKLFYPPLILIQLGVVWGTYFVLRSMAAKARRIDELEQELRDHPAATRERLRGLDPRHLQFISGPEHARVFREAIRSVSERLCVLSGWISDSVVDRAFVADLESALIRGASIFLGYGYEDSQGAHAESLPAKRALAHLRNLQRKSQRLGYPGRLHVGKFANHEKILVKDQNFVVCGSNNWLSNTRFRNSERSMIVRHPDFARAEGDRVAKLVAEHPA